MAVNGTNASETLDALDGVTDEFDTINGFGGDDFIFGLGGDDQILGGTGADALDGGEGVDTAFYINSLSGVVVSLQTGTGSGGEATGDTLVNIEHLTGSAHNDFLIGDAGLNVLVGGSGNDVIRGGAGGDNLVGGGGVDTAVYHDSSEGVTVGLNGDDGIGGTAQGDALSGFEQLMGSQYDDVLVGDGGGNMLSGVGGTDTIFGGGGADVLFGGSDNDMLKGGGGADVLIGDAGFDTASYEASSSGVEVLLLFDSAAGGDAEGDDLNGIENLTGSSFGDALGGDGGANTLDGEGGSDTLNGFAGVDILRGGNGTDAIDGGTGVDTMIGGNDSDTYYVDDAADTVTEGASQGINDWIRTSVSFTLAAGSHVENLRTTNHDGTDDINLTANALANSVWGNAGDNDLNGGGNADIMVGMEGDDRYFVDNTGDLIDEFAGNGSDQVIVTTAITYVLQPAVSVELMRTAGSASTTVINLTGNELVQTLQGNAAINTLNGGGGADTMLGYAGNDTYFVDNTGDLATETGGNGADRIIVSTSITYTMQAGTAVETLRTTGSASVYAVNLHGNNLANTVQGNNGINVLSGGLGNDAMSGFGGTDVFRFNTALGAGNIDTVTDFVVVDDLIQIDNAVFAGLAVGALDADAFHIGAAAADAEDRIVYDSGTGALYFDTNGSGAGGATQFATLSTGLAMTNADFNVI